MQRKTRQIITCFIILFIQFTTTPGVSQGFSKAYVEDSVSADFQEENGARTIGGLITDSDGDTLKLVTVSIKNTKIKKLSIDGQYTLKGRTGDTLVFCKRGYSTLEVPIRYWRNIDPVMKLSSRILAKQLPVDSSKTEEQINAGYWHVQNDEQTGNISKVTVREINQQSNSNILLALQGRIPGVHIQQNSGVRAGDIHCQIRGANSLSRGGNFPYYIVDGVPFTPISISSHLVSGDIIPNGSPLAYINPSHIESIEILKDADATAIYGLHGANGVILITTKKSEIGTPVIDIDLQQGFSQTTRTMDLLNTKQWLQMRKESFTNDNEQMTIHNAADILLADTTASTDWQKLLFGETSQTTNAKISMSWGSNQLQYNVGFGYERQSTVFPGNFGFQQGSGHFQLQGFSKTRRLRYTFSITSSASGNELPKSDPFTLSLAIPPNANGFIENGKFKWKSSSTTNPFAMLRQLYSGNTNNSIANNMLEYKIGRHLLLRSFSGYSQVGVEEIQRLLVGSINPAVYGSGISLFGDSRIKTWIIEPQIEYRKKIGTEEVECLLGGTIQETNTMGLTVKGIGYNHEEVQEALTWATEVEVLDAFKEVYCYQAVFGRLKFQSKKKYILNLAFRHDGSNHVIASKDFVTSGSLGAAWVFSKEAFHLPISFGKLRLAYGITRNDRLGNDRLLNSLLGPSNMTITGTPSGNKQPQYTWEKNKKAEVGMDLRFLSDHVSLSAAYYLNRSSSKLIVDSPDHTSGHGYNRHSVEIQNSGFEMTLGSTIDGHLFHWANNFNISIPRNKIIALPQSEGMSFPTDHFVEGKPVGVHKKYEQIGVSLDQGIYSFHDLNGDGRLNAGDKETHLEPLLDFYGGIQSSLHYKQWEVEVLFQFVRQTGENYKALFPFAPGSGETNQPELVMERWRKPGDAATIQRFTQSPDGPAALAYRMSLDSNAAISDASYVRLKNVCLSWRPPMKLIQKLNLQSLKAYIQGGNIFTLTKYQGLDPESRASHSIPPLRSLAIGVQFGF